jgi:single-strand DNA-binding protein
VQVRSYDAQDGQKRYVTEINADEIELLGSRSENAQATSQSQSMEQQGFTEVDDSDTLPF